jgi:spore germination cell wall hydrolase CwlJ-like protein
MASDRALELQKHLPNLQHPADTQVAILALCVWREARGESDLAKSAVARVIANRAADVRKRWPNSVAGVVLQPFQFTSFIEKDPNNAKFPAAHDPSWTSCVAAAQAAIAGAGPDPSCGANHYFDDSIKPPKWADPTKQSAAIGRLTFFRL